MAEPNEQQRAAWRQALERYRANMERLTARLRAEAGELRLLFVTPSPFDQTGVNDRNNNQPGCNDGWRGARRSSANWRRKTKIRSSISMHR